MASLEPIKIEIKLTDELREAIKRLEKKMDTIIERLPEPEGHADKMARLEHEDWKAQMKREYGLE